MLLSPAKMLLRMPYFWVRGGAFSNSYVGKTRVDIQFILVNLCDNHTNNHRQSFRPAEFDNLKSSYWGFNQCRSRPDCIFGQLRSSQLDRRRLPTVNAGTVRPFSGSALPADEPLPAGEESTDASSIIVISWPSVNK